MKNTHVTSVNTNLNNRTSVCHARQSSLPAPIRLHRAGALLALIAILSLSNFQLFAQATSGNGKALIVPPLINYSGVLKSSAGEPLTGVVGATFYIYKDSEGGAPLWMETQNPQLDSSGHYSVMLGSTKSHGLPDDLFAFGEPRWLSVQVQGEQEQPRALLVAVPYALKAADAATIGGLPPSAFVRATPDAASSTNGSGTPQSALSSSSSSSPRKSPSPLSPCSGVTGGGTTNFLPLWTTGCNLSNSVLFQAGGNVGIGTTSPNAPLEIYKNAGGTTNLILRNLNTGNGTLGILFSNAFWKDNGSAGEAAILAQDDGSQGGNLIFGTTTDGSEIYGIPSERMRITNNGNVGIGTTTPGATLDVSSSNQHGIFVEGPVSGVGAGIQLHTTGANGIGWEILNAGYNSGQGYGKLNFAVFQGSYFNNLMTLDSRLEFSACFSDAGCVGIAAVDPTNVLTVGQNKGHAIADGWDTYSSKRWKTNIQTLQGSLQKVEQLRGVSYDLKDSNKHEIGVIAEEVGAVVPEIVSWDNNGKDARGVDYSRLTALLIEAVKQQQQEIEGQQTQLAKALRQIRSDEGQLHAQGLKLATLKPHVRGTKENVQKVKHHPAGNEPKLLAAIQR